MGVTVRTAQHWAVQGDGRVPDYVWPKLRLLMIKRRAKIDKTLEDRDLVPPSLGAGWRRHRIGVCPETGELVVFPHERSLP